MNQCARKRTYVRSARTEFQKHVEISPTRVLWHVQFSVPPSVADTAVLSSIQDLRHSDFPLVGALARVRMQCVIELRETIVLCDRRRDLCAFLSLPRRDVTRFEASVEYDVLTLFDFRTERPHVFASTSRLCIGTMSLMQWLSKTKTRSHTDADIVITESSTSTTKVVDENGGRDRDQPCHSTEENSENLTAEAKTKTKAGKVIFEFDIEKKKKESHR